MADESEGVPLGQEPCAVTSGCFRYVSLGPLQLEGGQRRIRGKNLYAALVFISTHQEDTFSLCQSRCVLCVRWWWWWGGGWACDIITGISANRALCPHRGLGRKIWLLWRLSVYKTLYVALGRPQAG